MKKLFLVFLCALVLLAPLLAYATETQAFNAEGFPIVDEPVTLRIVRSQDPRNLPTNDMLWTQNYTKKTGVTIEWEEIPNASVTEKVNLMLASNNLPDAFMQTATIQMVAQYMDQGVFVPINDYIDKYCANLNAVLDQRPEYKAAITAPDGNIYGFPYIQEMRGLSTNQGLLYIYKPWLDALGLEMPTTMDEWREVVRAFVVDDPNGNGVADEIGFSLANKTATHGIGSWANNAGFGKFYGAWGQAMTGDLMNLDADGKVAFNGSSDAFRKGAEFFHEMYEGGLIDPDFSVMDSAMLNAKLNGPDVTVGSFLCYSIPDAIGTERVNEYVVVPFLDGQGGKMGCKENLLEMRNMAAFVITSACKSPEIAARWADGCYVPEESVQLNWGPLGYQYVQNEDGVMVFGPLQDGLATYDDMRARNTPGGNTPLAVLSEYYDKVVEYPQNAQRMIDDMHTAGYFDLYYDDAIIPTPNLWFDTQTAQRMAILAPQIFGLVDTQEKLFITDGIDDASWDNYIAQLKAANVDEYIGYVQAAYDHYASNLN